MNEATQRFAVVIPAYNEETTIRSVVEAALAEVARVIVVDDGSVDATAEALDGLPITLLREPTNSGKASALFRGVRTAVEQGARWIVTLDGDGQHRASDIRRLVAVSLGQPDAIVVGSRLHAKAIIPKARYRANRFANFWIAWAAGCPIADSQSGFRVYPAEVFAMPGLRHDRYASFVFESEVLIAWSRAGRPIASVPIFVQYGNAPRRSHFRPVVDIARIVVMVAGHLLRSGMNVPGLVRSLRRSRPADPSITASKVQ
jgi:glycosyltransferase involved in cell wall biosynthesis